MKFDTDYPADSVEFCSAQGCENLFVCGTYKLLQQEETGDTTNTELESNAPSSKRLGKCILFKVHAEQRDEKLEVLQEIAMPAILDMKWSPSSKVLAIAESEGHILLKKLDSDNQLQEIQTMQCRPKDTLCLSLDWSNRRNTNEPGSIAVSSSDGSISILRPDTTGSFFEFESWHAHDFEPWITAWNYWDTSILYSGGDDLKFKGWDIRQGTTNPTFVNKRFEAGVTSIQCHPHNENILAVGSYDATVRIFDTRKPLIPITQAEVGGGVWRVKWHPNPVRSTDLLVACMHDGFKVVRFSHPIIGSNDMTASSGPEWEILKRFDEHESLAYGADWSCRSGTTDDTLIASCSFYDHNLHTWKG